MSEPAMTIDGEPVHRNTHEVINPATGRATGRAPEATAGDVDAAFSAAHRAQPGWAQDPAGRRDTLNTVAEVIEGNLAELTPTLTSEQGKPLPDAERELRRAAQWFRYYAQLDLPVEVVQDDEQARAVVHRRPLGVVAAITPWNFPVSLASWKLAPALLAGNTVVLKPSPYTPLTTLRIGELLAPVLPDGVLNVLGGGDDVGRAMTAHPVPRKISFTGSIAAGLSVALAAAKTLKRTTLELGGNDAAIVLDDADPATVADGLFWGAFANNGQVCSAIKRVYVPRAMQADVVDRLAELARSVPVGDGTASGTRLGPVNNAAQLVRIEQLVDDARARGGRIVAGGERIDRDGYFYAPTIVTDVADDVRLVAEEQFGPALPVLSYDSLDEAVARANGTDFGLSGSVWSGDAERAAEVAGRLDCGTVWVNAHLVLQPHLPFGGAKLSGLGVENGPWGLYGFTELKVVYSAKPG